MSPGRGVLLLSDPPLGGYAGIGAGGEDPEVSGGVSPKKQHRRILCPGNDGALSGVETVVVTGCCTDICILQLVLTLKAA